MQEKSILYEHEKFINVIINSDEFAIFNKQVSPYYIFLNIVKLLPINSNSSIVISFQ